MLGISTSYLLLPLIMFSNKVYNEFREFPPAPLQPHVRVCRNNSQEAQGREAAGNDEMRICSNGWIQSMARDGGWKAR